MTKEIEALREYYLTDVDEDTRRENEEYIRGIESDLAKNEAYARWRSLEITEGIAKDARTKFVALSMQLAEGRELSEGDRHRLFALKDACMYILKLTSRDAQSEIDAIHQEIKTRLELSAMN